MKTKADSLTRLVERTMGRTPVARPMIPPLFSFAGPGDGLTRDLNDNYEPPLPVKENEKLSLPGEQPPQPLLMQQEPVEPVSTSNANSITSPQTLSSQPLPPGKRKTGSVPVPGPKKPGLHEEVTPARPEEPEKVILTKPREKGSREPVYPTALHLESQERPEPVDSPLIDKNREELLIKENHFSKDLFISKPGERISSSPVPLPGELMDSEQQPGDKNERLFGPLNGRKMVQPVIPDKKVSWMSPKESEAPAVSVTIGRVEVRAVMQQPVLPPQPPPAANAGVNPGRIFANARWRRTMSNHLAIAAVTATLRDILYEAVSADMNGITVSILPPDHDDLTNDTARLNIFLYQVTPNTACRNTELPTRQPDGSLSKRPQLALNLDYLLTVYGTSSEDNPETHRILGSAMRTLHEKPMLTRKTINKTILADHDEDPKTENPLKDSDLADQIELVKFSPITLNLEEMSKLWSVFFQTPYRLSVAYRASVVLIDGKGVPGPALPVRKPGIFVTPFSRPHIESISPQLATLDQPLEIYGQNLKSKWVKVVFRTVSAAPDTDKIKNKKIKVILPTELRAGVNTVKVVHELKLNQQTGPHKAVESNTAAFMLRPVFKKDPEFSVVTLPDGSTKETIELVIKPKVEKSQQVVLLLNQLNPPANKVPLAYQFNAPADNGITGSNTETDTITFTIEGVTAGDYLVRARVDGAESPLELDAATGKYNKPQVTIT